jgi:hypothetical protein
MISVPYAQWEISMKTLFHVVVTSAVAMAGLALSATVISAADQASGEKVYELRIYKTNPGKLPALHTRFREHTCQLFKKHGIELIGFWTPTEGPEAKDRVYYIVAFPSVAAQKKAWEAFESDPEWLRAKAESQTHGVLVKEVISKNMKATDYSPIR